MARLGYGRDGWRVASGGWGWRAGNRIEFGPIILLSHRPPPRWESTVIEIGITLNQRFLLEKELGRGGMGAVYSATDQVLQRKVAIKVLKEQSGEEVGKRLRLEATDRRAAAARQCGADLRFRSG